MNQLDFKNDNTNEYNPENFYNIIKMAINFVPYGGCLNQAISIMEQKNQLKLMEEIKLRLNKLEATVRNVFDANLKNEDMFFYYALIKSKNCHHKNQISKLAEIIVAALAEEKINLDDAEILINIVSEMNYSEVKIFQWLCGEFNKQPSSDRKKLMDWAIDKRDIISCYEDGNKSKTIGLLYRLVSYGLIYEVSLNSGYMWHKQGEESDDIIHYRFTYYGGLWIKIINGFVE